MKRVNIKCPYCGSRVLLRPAPVVYGPKARDPAAPCYVCARYPACDSYVAAHRDTGLPMGTLANTVSCAGNASRRTGLWAISGRAA